MISVPLPKKEYSLVPLFMSRSKRTYSQCSFQIQPTDGWLFSDDPPSFPASFPITKFSSLLRRLLTVPRNMPSFSSSKAGIVFGIVCPFKRYRVYSGFLSISKMTLIVHAVCFTTTTTLTQNDPFAPDLSRLDTSALPSSSARFTISSKSRQFLLLTIVLMPPVDVSSVCSSAYPIGLVLVFPVSHIHCCLTFWHPNFFNFFSTPCM
jgi:hypothetical protein